METKTIAQKKCLNCMNVAELCFCAEGPNYSDIERAKAYSKEIQMAMEMNKTWR